MDRLSRVKKRSQTQRSGQTTQDNGSLDPMRRPGLCRLRRLVVIKVSLPHRSLSTFMTSGSVFQQQATDDVQALLAYGFDP